MRKGYSFVFLHVHIQLSKLFSQLLNHVLCLCRTFQGAGGEPGQNLPGQCGHLNWPREAYLILLVSAFYYDKTRNTVRHFFLTVRNTLVPCGGMLCSLNSIPLLVCHPIFSSVFLSIQHFTSILAGYVNIFYSAIFRIMFPKSHYLFMHQRHGSLILNVTRRDICFGNYMTTTMIG